MNMKHILVLFTFMCFSLTSFAQMNYKEIGNTLKTEIKTVKKELTQLKKEVKKDVNNVTAHKAYVVKCTELENLKEKQNKLKYAQKLYKELAKRNSKFDKEKVILLKLKEDSKIADEEILRLMK